MARKLGAILLVLLAPGFLAAATFDENAFDENAFDTNSFDLDAGGPPSPPGNPADTQPSVQMKGVKVGT